MFSFLNLLSQGLNYLGFFNIGNRGNKVLNQVYIIVGILGDLYLFYAGGRFITNGFFIHGALILLASLALVYFLYINFYYYFLKREAPLDVSPGIEKKLGLKQFNEAANRSRRNLNALVRDLMKAGNLRTDYAGLNGRQLLRRLKRDHHRPVYAIGAGALWRIFAGVDAVHERYVGRIARIGLQSIQDVDRHVHAWKPVLTSVILVGGPYQFMGRSRVYKPGEPYRLQVNIRFERKMRKRKKAF
ncbi:MAG: Hypothetical protein AJITA_00215 [Acetilactobacillus jinshanensis]